MSGIMEGASVGVASAAFRQSSTAMAVPQAHATAVGVVVDVVVVVVVVVVLMTSVVQKSSRPVIRCMHSVGVQTAKRHRMDAWRSAKNWAMEV